jgi:hypothetical protein
MSMPAPPPGDRGTAHEDAVLTAEELRAYRIARADRWARLARRLLMVAAVTWTALRLPLPMLNDYLQLRDVIVTITSILVTGKLLFDTLFFDHYWP